MHSDQVDSCLAQLVGIIWWEDDVRSAGHGPGTVSLLCVSIPEHTLLRDICTQVFQRVDGYQKTCERIWLNQGTSLYFWKKYLKGHTPAIVVTESYVS